MEAKAVELLDVLAAKLGVAVPFIWEVLVKQATVTSIVYSLCLLGMVGLAVPFVVKYVQHMNTIEWAFEEKDVAALVVLVLYGLVTFITGLACIDPIMTGFLNPEYAAFQDITSLVPGK